MKSNKLVAQAAALGVAQALKNNGHFFCEQLPEMDVSHFLHVLDSESQIENNFSLALVGYQLDQNELSELLGKFDLPIGYITDDLHVAALWRNTPEDHPSIVALATGRNPGVSTLAHFPQGNSRELAVLLLKWASVQSNGIVATARQVELLKSLAEVTSLEPLVSLRGVVYFLSSWTENKTTDDLSAPRKALPQLGILPDRNLLDATISIPERLLKNFQLTSELMSMPGSRFERIRSRIASDENSQRRNRNIEILRRINELRRSGKVEFYDVLEFEQVQDVLQKPKNEDADDVTDDPTDPPPETTHDDSIRDNKGVSKDVGSALIDGDDTTLMAIVISIEASLKTAIDQELDEVSGEYEVNESFQSFEFQLDRELLTWIRYFCSIDSWGGYYETQSISFEEALANPGELDPVLCHPEQESIALAEGFYSVSGILEPIQNELHKKGLTGVDICALWKKIVDIRAQVLDAIELLIHQPILAISGKQKLSACVGDLVEAWEEFYETVAKHHSDMHEIDHEWTRTLFEVVTSLDVVQIKSKLDDERTTWKAVLLPTHPLHLWRYERMADLTRGLKLEGIDRDAVLSQLYQPEHFLEVIYLSSFPEGRGGSRPLPISRDYRGLAVFENFKNVYSGNDGVDSLRQCVRKFMMVYVNHTQPLRLAIINPPDLSAILVPLLDDSRIRRRSDISFLVDIYATSGHEARLMGARRFSTADRDLIEEHVDSGRLRLRIRDEILPLNDLLARFHQAPVHIVAVFDVATTAMRRTPSGINTLPMSPFVMRRRIGFQGIQKKVELQSSMENSVFRSFFDMVGKLDQETNRYTPQASADAERMRSHIEAVLLKSQPGAFWFFFADRSLPSSGNTKVARIFERQYRKRRTVCYDASYERLALILRGPLDEFNLRFTPAELKLLLGEGVALIGEGLIDLFDADGKPDKARVRGLAGTLIAAREYRKRFPQALLVSVDTQLARLWLRLAERGERCDLMGLRSNGNQIIVDAIEVKTVGTGSNEVAQSEIDKAMVQLKATMDAVQSGLNEDNPQSQTHPLSAPRQEMLKEVFVSGCQSQTAQPIDRERWAKWLKLLFNESETKTEVVLSGTIYAVELSNNNTCTVNVVSDDPFKIEVRRIREQQIQTLISTEDVISGNEVEESHTTSEPEVLIESETQDPTNAAKTEDIKDMSNTSSSNQQRDSQTTAVESTPVSRGVQFKVGESIGVGKKTPFFFNPSNTKLNQLNIGVVGDLGTGKTQLIKSLIYQYSQNSAQNLNHRPKFLIFDYKQDYTKEDFVDAVGARVVKPHNIPLNIFDLENLGDRIQLAKLRRVKFLNDVLSKIYGGIGPKQRNQLKKAVLNCYENTSGRTPSLSDVVSAYEDIVGDKIDAPYSILSDLVDLEIFVKDASKAVPFGEFFNGVVVVDLAAFGIGEKEKNMLLVLMLNLYYEYMIGLKKHPYYGNEPQLRIIESMLLVDEADNIMKYNFDVLRQILLQGREFGIGVLLASQYLSHFRTRETDYSEPLLTWFIHKVPNVTVKELESIGLSNVRSTTVEKVKSQDVHHCLFKTYDVPGKFMSTFPFYELVNQP